MGICSKLEIYNFYYSTCNIITKFAEMSSPRIRLKRQRSKRLRSVRKYIFILANVVIWVVLLGILITQLSTDNPPIPITSPTLAPTIPALIIPDQQMAILDLLNRLRIDNGLHPLQVNVLLQNAAQTHSNDMAQGQFMSHVGSLGTTPSDRATTVGYPWLTVGENVLVRPNMDANGAFQQWFNSQGHYDNMMNPDFEEVGIAYTQSIQGDFYYTMLLGTQN